MDKIAKVPHLREELDWLDQTYGVEKEGFFHQEHWQLLVAIMLSAQSTDKQVDEVLPKLYGRFPTSPVLPADAVLLLFYPFCFPQQFTRSLHDF